MFDAYLYDYLLEEYFVASKIPENQLSPEDVINYIESLNEYIKIWYIINNPDKSTYNADIIEWIKKIDYLLSPQQQGQVYRFGLIQADRNKVLLLDCIKKCPNEVVLLKFLKSFERFLFLVCFIPYDCYERNFDLINLEIPEILRKLKKGDMVVAGVKKKSTKWSQHWLTMIKSREASDLITTDSGFTTRTFLNTSYVNMSITCRQSQKLILLS